MKSFTDFNVALEEGMYDIDPKTGESPVATAVNKANKMSGDKRLKSLSKLAKKLVGEEALEEKKGEKNCGCGQDPCITYGDHRHKDEKKVEEATLATARKNIGMDPKKPSCWKGYKASGTKMKGGKSVPDCKKEEVELEAEGTKYGLYKGSGKAGGAMKDFLDKKAKKLEAAKKKQKPEYRNNPAFGDPSHHSNAKNRTEGADIADILARLEKKRISKGGDPNKSPLPSMKKYHASKKKIKESIEKEKEEADGTPSSVEEAKVDKGRSDYGKASIRNYRRMGPGHGDPGMFDPEGKRGKTIDKRREEHKSRRGVKGAKVPAYKKEEVEQVDEIAMPNRAKRSNPYSLKNKLKMVIKSAAEKSRRKAGVTSEETVNELHKKTLGSYVKKAATEIGTSAMKGDYEKMKKRHKGVLDASDKMQKEEVTMTRAEYKKIHKDFKSDDPKKPRTTKYVQGKGTVSMPVKFSD